MKRLRIAIVLVSFTSLIFIVLFASGISPLMNNEVISNVTPPVSAKPPDDFGIIGEPPAQRNLSFGGISRSARVKTLVNSGGPLEAYQAFAIIGECSLAREVFREEQLVKRAERTVGALEAAESRVHGVCGDLTESETTIQRQIALLDVAATAGIPGAAIRLINLGPLGDFNNLSTRPNDPLILEWRKRMGELLLLAARKRDTEALLSLAKQYAEGDGVIGQLDVATSLKFAVAYKALRGQQGMPDKHIDRVIFTLAEKLPADQVAEATRQGLDFLAPATSGGT